MHAFKFDDSFCVRLLYHSLWLYKILLASMLDFCKSSLLTNSFYLHLFPSYYLTSPISNYQSMAFVLCGILSLKAKKCSKGSWRNLLMFFPRHLPRGCTHSPLPYLEYDALGGDKSNHKSAANPGRNNCPLTHLSLSTSLWIVWCLLGRGQY